MPVRPKLKLISIPDNPLSETKENASVYADSAFKIRQDLMAA